MSLDAKQAVEAAKRYVLDVLGRSDTGLEEIEKSSDEIYWYVTLGFVSNYLTGQKEYKILKIDASSGEVLSMKIRT